MGDEYEMQGPTQSELKKAINNALFECMAPNTTLDELETAACDILEMVEAEVAKRRAPAPVYESGR